MKQINVTKNKAVQKKFDIHTNLTAKAKDICSKLAKRKHNWIKFLKNVLIV